MSGDDDQPPLIMSCEVQGQLDGLSKEMKEIAASIAMLLKAITPKDNPTAQSGSNGITDPQMVPESAMDPRRIQDIESVKEGDSHLNRPQRQSRSLLVPSSSWPSD